MNITTTKLDNVSMRLTVNVEESDYKTKVVDELKRIGRTHTIPGFRKGHISIQDLQRRFGRQVTSDVINNEVYEAVVKYIDENKLNVLGQPMPVEVKELDLKNQKDFTFEYDLALAPQLDIEIDKNVTLPLYTIAVTDEMIDEQDKHLRKRFGKQEPGPEFEEDALVKGAIKQLDVKEGEQAIEVENGIVAPMYFADKEQAEKFKGAKVGDTVVFNPKKAAGDKLTELASMLNVDKERAAQVEGDFEIKISEIIVVRLAELGEEFYTQVFGADKVHDEAEYRAAIKDMIAGELAGNSEVIFRFTVKNDLMGKYGNMQLPDELLKKWLVSRNEELTAENIEERYPNIVQDLKWQLIRDNVAGKLGVKITEDALMSYAKSMAVRQFAQYGMANMPEDVIEKYAKNMLEDNNSRSRIIEQVGDRILFQAIANAITLDNKEVSLDEFNEIASKL